MTAPVLRPAFAHLTGDEAMQAIRFKGQVQALRDDNARQAIIEHNRTMKAQRQFAAANADRINAEWEAMDAPPRTIAEHLAAVRSELTDEQFAALNGEWEE